MRRSFAVGKSCAVTRRPSRAPRLLCEELEPRTLLSASSPLQALPLAALQVQGVRSAVTNLTVPAGALQPSQVRQAYGFNLLPLSNAGAGQTIAIVDAYNDPNIVSDLHTFDTQFGLSDPVFTQLNETGGTTLPRADPSGDWELEESLDVEWAHALAPGAKIVLVEASSATYADLFKAVQTAASQASVVSMSWGGGEFSGETSYDSSVFSQYPTVTFVASAGDNGAPPIYPAISPYVVSVGGTTLNLANSSGSYGSESAWSGGGGGVSAYEGLPGYQAGVEPAGVTKRTGPDVSYDANPSTGFAIYDSVPYYPRYPRTLGGQSGWFQVGGTSAGAPQWSALIALADQQRATASLQPLGSLQTLDALYSGYSNASPSALFHDITSGTTLGRIHYSAVNGYDLATGLGSPVASQVFQTLAGWTAAGSLAGVAGPHGSASRR